MPYFMYVKASQCKSLLSVAEGWFRPAKTMANRLQFHDEIKLVRLTAQISPKYWKYRFNPHLIRPVSLALLFHSRLPKIFCKTISLLSVSGISMLLL